MPFFDQPVPPAMPGRPAYENEVVKKWTAEIARSDGFIFVAPEYNYGSSAVLKNALDAPPGQVESHRVSSPKEDAAAHPIRSGDERDPSSAPPKW